MILTIGLKRRIRSIAKKATTRTGAKSLYVLCLTLVFFGSAYAQRGGPVVWSADGNAVYVVRQGDILKEYPSQPGKQEVLLSQANLTPAGSSTALEVRRFTYAENVQKLLINTNTKRVWRQDTKGDYWLYDIKEHSLTQLGKGLPPSSLMFAKLSPDGSQAAYVSGHNLYLEDLVSGKITPLTTEQNDRIINGTFDWAYEEEFGCRDGFRWSPDGQKIAFWTIDARHIRNFLMIDNTDSTYSFTKPVEYPKAGQDPSGASVSVIDIHSGSIVKMNIPGDPVQHYLPRMEWAGSADKLIVQQLNRKQNESALYLLEATSGLAKKIYTETDSAWIDVDGPMGWEWIEQGKAFIWQSEKDGWRHLYRIDLEGHEKLLTPGDYDVINLGLVDEKGGSLYFSASPENATQAYLYRVKLTGGRAERLSPANETGTHSYTISPNGELAMHQFSCTTSSLRGEVVSLPDHHVVVKGTRTELEAGAPRPEFFKVKTADSVELDGWMVKPTHFDPEKKYPVVFYVYGEPASNTVKDTYGQGSNRLYAGNMADDGYIYMSVDNRGTPAPKGRKWRKAIYRNIGILNVHDQAMAAKEILKWPFVDSSRVAVWGWSGGGSSTLNLLFQYPDIYKTGIAVAGVANQLMYDNIYQERYMGVPPETLQDYIKGSPVSHASGLKGNLLYIHGTGDDNVHYQNAELLLNELIKYNKQFQFMAYPNRTHGISEGEGTNLHLKTLYTHYLQTYCPPGGR